MTETTSPAQPDDCAGHGCDCGVFAPVVIGHAWQHGGDRGYSECWTFAGPDGAPGQLFIWETGTEAHGDGSVDIGESFDNIRTMVVDTIIPDLLADGYVETAHEGPVDGYEEKLAAAWRAQMADPDAD